MQLNVEGDTTQVEVERVINLGYSGRDQDAVQDHIEELASEGIDPPDQVPMTYQVAPYIALVDPGNITVIGDETSGEAEFGLLVTSNDIFVLAASDHTDRNLESENVQLSKQVTPNVISRTAWRMENVREQWSEISITAVNTREGKEELYQKATLGEILSPEKIIELCEQRHCGSLNGTLILSGTVPTESGGVSPGERFEVVLEHPTDDRELRVGYDIRTVEM